MSYDAPPAAQPLRWQPPATGGDARRATTSKAIWSLVTGIAGLLLLPARSPASWRSCCRATPRTRSAAPVSPARAWPRRASCSGSSPWCSWWSTSSCSPPASLTFDFELLLQLTPDCRAGSSSSPRGQAASQPNAGRLRSTVKATSATPAEHQQRRRWPPSRRAATPRHRSTTQRAEQEQHHRQRRRRSRRCSRRRRPSRRWVRSLTARMPPQPGQSKPSAALGHRPQLTLRVRVAQRERASWPRPGRQGRDRTGQAPGARRLDGRAVPARAGTVGTAVTVRPAQWPDSCRPILAITTKRTPATTLRPTPTQKIG